MAGRIYTYSVYKCACTSWEHILVDLATRSCSSLLYTGLPNAATPNIDLSKLVLLYHLTVNVARETKFPH